MLPAENKKQLFELLDMVSVYVEEQENAGLSVISKEDAEKIIEYFNKTTDWQKRKDKILGADPFKAIVFKQQAGESNRIGLLKGIPVPLMPESCAKADPSANEKYAELVRNAYGQGASNDPNVKNQGEDAIRKMYMQQATAQMGGITPEQLKNMTPEQQRAAAMKIYEAAMNPNTGNSKPGGESNEAMELEKYAMDVRTEIMNALQPVMNRFKQNEELHMQRSKALEEWVKKAEAKLPLPEGDESVGRREGIDRVLFVRDWMGYFITRDKVLHDRELWESYMHAVLPIIQKIDAFTGRFETSNNLSERMKAAVANIKTAGFETILEVNRAAGLITETSFRIQRNYNCSLLKKCD